MHIWINVCHQIRMQLIRRYKYAALIQHGLLGLMSTMSPSNSNSEYIGGDLWGAERRYFSTYYPLAPLRRLQRSGLSALKWFRLGCPELQSCFQPDLFGKVPPLVHYSENGRLRTSLWVHHVQLNPLSYTKKWETESCRMWKLCSTLINNLGLTGLSCRRVHLYTNIVLSDSRNSPLQKIQQWSHPQKWVSMVTAPKI